MACCDWSVLYTVLHVWVFECFWVGLFGSETLTVLCHSILNVTYRVYQAYYQSHQLSTESSSTISWIGSLQVFFLYAGGAIGGPLFDRYGGLVRFPRCY